jgi:ATP-binding cassette subfamily F protein 1
MNPYNFIFEKLTYNFNNISISNFTLSVNSSSNNGKVLLDNSSLSLNKPNIYGFIGKNGYGKSSFLKQFGNICDPEKLRILYVEQELILDERTPIDFILDSNVKLKVYTDKVNILRKQFETDTNDYNEELYKELEEAEMILSSYNPDKEISLIKKILFGLGFSNELMESQSNIFSGGWQMRISLARALYLEPDLLLLDEPTNHLDLEAIIWLGDYLHKWKKIAIVVSHNIGFLNDICNFILNIENKQLVMYKGNYTIFKNTFTKKFNEQKKEYEKFEKKIKDMKKKGTLKNKIDEQIKNNKIQRPEKDYDIRIDFFPTRKYNNNIIKLENISFGYNENNLILDDISFGLDMNSRITLVGLNGCGKSTLIKLITQEIKPLKGYINISDNIKIGYYNQHFDQQLPLDKTPIEFLSDIVPPDELLTMNKYEIVRKYLGRIKLESNAHTKLISELSGGQKARVAFIKLIFQKPHFLLLDEPTNHLDIETVEILIESLESYNGGILLITHEPEIINKLNTRLWLLKNKKINYNMDSFDSYCEQILSL